jgi:hypothetical protein
MFFEGDVTIPASYKKVWDGLSGREKIGYEGQRGSR